MKINYLLPQGFCLGVITALKIIDNALLNNDIKKPIYLLGNIIHNKKIIDQYKEKGVCIIHDKNKTRLELLDMIDSGTVIFSAHGVSPKVFEKAKSKNLNIIDASCRYVLKIQQLIKEKLSEGFSIIYLGTKNHPESEAIIGIDKEINFVTSTKDIENLNISNELIYVTSQTTLGITDLRLMYQMIKDKYPTSYIDTGVCNATTKRQLAVLNQEKCDLTIVVGDRESSNTMKLYKLSQSINNTILVLDKNDLKDFDFTNIKSVNITSGASTPKYVVDEIIDFLNNIN